MSRITLGDFSRLSDVDLLETATLWHGALCDPPHPRFVVCLSCRIRDEITSLSMDELRARSAGLKPHRAVSLPLDGAP